MRRLGPSLLLALSLAAAGCGSSPTFTAPVPALPDVTGNWQFQAQTALSGPTTITYVFTGALAPRGSNVTGTLRLLSGFLSGSSCVPPVAPVAFTGTINAAQLLTLTSAPFAGGSVASASVQLPLDPKGFANGTAQIDGGTCAAASEPLLGIYVPPVTGSYSGTFAPINITGQTGTATGPATLTLTQSAADAEGMFPLNGSFTFQGNTCVLSGAVTGKIAGASMQLQGPAAQMGLLPAFTLVGTPGLANQSFLNLTLNVPAPTVSCPSFGSYHASMMRQ